MSHAPHISKPAGNTSVLPHVGTLLLAPLQPVLGMIVRRIAAESPEVLDRLGSHQQTRFIIDPVDCPFVLVLHPSADRLLLKAVVRSNMPEHDAKVSGKLLHLVRLIDGDEDGDAIFFSRDLTIAGDTEAIVTLRNALDNAEGAMAERVAGMFGPPGRLALQVMRRVGGWERREGTL